MEDGYWTPWHIAADLLQRLASDNAGLEAAAESLFGTTSHFWIAKMTDMTSTAPCALSY
jgi:hypothetical protein